MEIYNGNLDKPKEYHVLPKGVTEGLVGANDRKGEEREKENILHMLETVEAIETLTDNNNRRDAEMRVVNSQLSATQ